MKLKKEWFTREFLTQRTMLFSFASLVLNFIMGVAKLVIATIIHSYYLGMNGIYNMILFLAKNNAVRKLNKLGKIENDENKQEIETRTCYNLCFYACGATLVYLAMSVVLTFFLPETPQYGLIVAIYLAAVGTGKLIAGIISSVKTRKDTNLIVHNIKLVNLVDACISVGLLQRAILMAMDAPNADYYSGIGGIIFSVLGLAVAVFMIFELSVIKKRKYKNSNL